MPTTNPFAKELRVTLIELEDAPKSRENDDEFEAAFVRLCKEHKRRVLKFMPEDLERVGTPVRDCRGVSRNETATGPAGEGQEHADALTNFPVPVLAETVSTGDESSEAMESTNGLKALCRADRESIGGEFNLTTFPVEQSAGTASGSTESRRADASLETRGDSSDTAGCARQHLDAGVAPGPLAINSRCPVPRISLAMKGELFY